MLVKCSAIVCINNQSGMCASESIQIVDMEEKENIKFKDKDFNVCKTFEWRKED